MALRAGLRPVGSFDRAGVTVQGQPQPKKFRVLRKRRVAPAQPAYVPTGKRSLGRKGGVEGASARIAEKKAAILAAKTSPSEIQDQYSEQSSGSQEQEQQPQEQEQQPQAQQEQPQEEQPQEQQEQEQPQEQEEQAPQEDGSYMGREISIPLISTHVSGKKVHSSAVCMTPGGVALVHCRTKTPKTNNRFGMERTMQAHRAILTEKGMVEKLKQDAAQLVIRAREGDQNAMAIIALVRDNAKRGIPRATQSYGFLKQYIDKHPVASFGHHETPNHGDTYHTEVNTANRYLPNDSRFHESDYRAAFSGEPNKRYMSSFMSVGNEDYWSSIMLANGQPLTTKKVQRVVSSFGTEDEQQAFMSGMLKWRKEHEAEHKRLGIEMNSIQQKIAELGKIVGRARGLQVLRMPHSKISKFDKNVAWELGE